jgi:xanthine dehydrogenase accessory factor
MIKAQLATRITQLTQERMPFVLATVVRARRPTSVRPGDTAIVTTDGSIDGFVGGVCAESSVRLYSLRALETGEPVLLRLVPGGGGGDDEAPDGIDGAVVEHNPCLSGGALEIFIEPQLPAPRLIVMGGSPTAAALAEVGAAAGYAADRLASLENQDLAGAAAVIVASHGSEEERVLAAALAAGVPYVALVASPVRGEAVRAALELPSQLAAQLRTPAGLDIGARTPHEIAISILAELIASGHRDPVPGRPGVTSQTPADRGSGPGAERAATDPICGMTVAIAPATHRLGLLDGGTVYFCGTGCRDAYARQHAPHGAGG